MACQGPELPPLRVATAANVQFAMDSLASSFTRQTGIPVEIILGSSGKLTTQIVQGAPFDLFLSADLSYPTYLYEQKLTFSPPQTYAQGKLVLWEPQAKEPIDLERLLAADLRHIALANPETAPYGHASMQALHFWGWKDSLSDKLVFGESLGQTNQFIQSGAASLGFTAASVVKALPPAKAGHWVPVPEEAYPPILQGMVGLKNSQQPAQVKQFLTFMMSEESQAVLRAFGYETDLSFVSQTSSP